jgi:hypothetical protein
MEITFVGLLGGNFHPSGFDNRQGVRNLAFLSDTWLRVEQSGMQVKYITRVGFAAPRRRSNSDIGDRPRRAWSVIINDEACFPCLEVFTMARLSRSEN